MNPCFLLHATTNPRSTNSTRSSSLLLFAGWKTETRKNGQRSKRTRSNLSRHTSIKHKYPPALSFLSLFMFYDLLSTNSRYHNFFCSAIRLLELRGEKILSVLARATIETLFRVCEKHRSDPSGLGPGSGELMANAGRRSEPDGKIGVHG